MTTSMRPPYWPSSARCVMTPTPTGTNSSDRWASRKLAHSATGSRTMAKRSPASISIMPSTGPGSGSARPRDSSSPTDWNTSSQAIPRKPFMGGPARLLEHHGAVAVQQHPVLAVPLDGARQHLALGVAAAGGQGLDRVGVVGALHVLLDDRPLVEVGRHVVGGGADQLHAAVVRLVVGLGALEDRQEREVDDERPDGQLDAQLVAEDLHVARQHHQVGP